VTNAGKKTAGASELTTQLQPKSACQFLRSLLDAPPHGGSTFFQVAFTNSDDAAPPAIALFMKVAVCSPAAV
jgi:hypothetical protein